MDLSITTGGGTIYTNATVWPAWNVNVNYSATSNMANTSITSATIQQAWAAWNQNYTTGTCNTCTSSSTFGLDTWIVSQTTTNTLNHVVWDVWNDRADRIQAAGAEAERIRRYSRRQLTEEELLVELEREKRLREEAELRALKLEQANARAEKLLRACLSDQQIEDLEKKNCFYVEVAGREGKKERYRIDRGSHGNVKQIDETGSIIRSFCIQPPGVPIPDVMLTQKLYLEASDETRNDFWKTANITELKAEKAIPYTVPRHERRRYAEAHGLLH